jgi:uncharacterized protein (UPF0333 family)
MKILIPIVIAIIIIAGGAWYINSLQTKHQIALDTITETVEQITAEKVAAQYQATYYTIVSNILLTYGPDTQSARTILPNSDYTMFAVMYNAPTETLLPKSKTQNIQIELYKVLIDNADTKQQLITFATIPAPETKKTPEATVEGIIRPIGFYADTFVYSIDYDGRGDSECSSPWIDNSGELYAINLTAQNPATAQVPKAFTITPAIQTWAKEQLPSSCAVN